MKTFVFTLVTPERKLLEREIVRATLPTMAGEITILPEHMPIVSRAKAGEIIIADAEGREDSFVISGGFIDFRGQTLSILADSAEAVSEIDLARAEEAVRRAEELNARKNELSSEDAERAVAALEHAWARTRIARRHRSHGGIHNLDA